MATPPNSRTVGHRATKACLVAVDKTIGFLEFAVEGEDANGSIFVQNPPGSSIIVSDDSRTPYVLAQNTFTIPAGAIAAFGSIIDLGGLINSDFTTYIKVTDSGGTAIVDEVQLRPFMEFPFVSGGSIIPYSRATNIQDSEWGVFFGPTLEMGSGGSFQGAALQLGAHLSSVVGNNVIINYKIIGTKVQ